MFEYILFDFDGTISDSKEGIVKSVAYALEHFGIITENLDDLTYFVGPPLGEPFRQVYQMDDVKTAKAVALFRERYFKQGMWEAAMFPGIPDLLQDLKAAGKKIALATSKGHVIAREILDDYGITSYFDIIMGAELDGTRSKKSEVVAEVLCQFGITDENLHTAVLIGDRKYDVEGARTCGISCIGVQYGYASPEEWTQAAPDHLVASVEELKSFLLQTSPASFKK